MDGGTDNLGGSRRVEEDEFKCLRQPAHNLEEPVSRESKEVESRRAG